MIEKKTEAELVLKEICNSGKVWISEESLKELLDKGNNTKESFRNIVFTLRKELSSQDN